MAFSYTDKQLDGAAWEEWPLASMLNMLKKRGNDNGKNRLRKSYKPFMVCSTHSYLAGGVLYLVC